MYLPELERKKMMDAYGLRYVFEIGHYQVEPDKWIYLFEDSKDNKYILIVADYLDLEVNHFPYLLRFDNAEFYTIDLVLQREISSQDCKKTAHSILFRYQ